MEALSGDALGLETPCSPPAAAIVVTPPSSPDDPSRPPPKLLRTPPLPALKPLPVLSDRMHSAPFDSTPLSPAPFFALDPGMPSFQERLATSSLPPPGANHFAARRALWLSPGPSPPRPTEANPSRQKLEALLTSPNALEDDQIWDTGVNKVWRGLIGGARLKRRLPLALVLKILQAGWIREGTWPKGALPPESDEPANAVNEPAILPTTISGISETANPCSHTGQDTPANTTHTN